MTFFYDLNKKLDEIRATPSTTHSQLNERDMGKHNNATTGFKALAKKAGGGEKGEKIAGAQFQKMKKAGQLEEEGMGDMARKVGGMAKKVGGAVMNKLHGSDEDMIRDLQRKTGMPQTGLKPGNTPNPKQVKEKMNPAKAKSFAALAPPKNKITFADKIAGAKKEVDEMLGDVAAEAIKGALSGKQKQLDKNNNGKLDANDFAMLRNGSKKKTAEEDDNNPFTSYKKPRTEKPRVGSIERGHKHDIEHTATGRKVTRRVDDQGNSVGADDAGDTEPQKRGRGRPAGTGSKMGAKGPSGRSKLMTKENDRDPGEYDQEGDMAKDSIKTVVRHAQALEKILGDNDNLPEWVQSKLAKIEGMMTAVDDYMQNQQGDDEMAMGEEKTSTRDNRAERAGRKVAKDIEYDEKKKDGIHGKKRGSEDDKAEKAGRKVAKDIEHDEKKKKVKEQGGSDTPTASSGFSYGQGIYDSMNHELETMIRESMNVNMSMNNDANGGPSKSVTVTATDDDAMKLGELLKNAGLGGDHSMGDTAEVEVHGAENIADKIRQAMGDEGHEDGETCDACGQADCGCEEMDEAAVNVSNNQPDYPTNTETAQDSFEYSGGLNGPKSTGQTTIPVIAGQEDRQHTYEQYKRELRKMLEMSGIEVTDEMLEEGWKEKLGAAGLAGAMALGSLGAGAAQAAPQQSTSAPTSATQQQKQEIWMPAYQRAFAYYQSTKNPDFKKELDSAVEAHQNASIGSNLAQKSAEQQKQLDFKHNNRLEQLLKSYGAMDNLRAIKEQEQVMALEESVTESFEQMLSRMRDIAGIKEAKKPDFLDIDKDGDKKEPMKKAVDDKKKNPFGDKKVAESLMAELQRYKKA